MLSKIVQTKYYVFLFLSLILQNQNSITIHKSAVRITEKFIKTQNMLINTQESKYKITQLKNISLKLLCQRKRKQGAHLLDIAEGGSQLGGQDLLLTALSQLVRVVAAPHIHLTLLTTAD